MSQVFKAVRYFEFFPPSGLPMEPRLYCSDRCRQEASLIRRTAKLPETLGEDAVVNVFRLIKWGSFLILLALTPCAYPCSNHAQGPLRIRSRSTQVRP